MKMPESLRRVWDWIVIVVTLPCGWHASHIVWCADEQILALLVGVLFLASFTEALSKRLNRDIALELAK